MARTRRDDTKVAEQAPDVELDAPVADEAEPTPEGVFDIEAWVAAVYDYQNNDGPYPQRTYVVAPSEPVHVDAVGAVTAVEHDSDGTDEDSDAEQADDDSPAASDETSKD